MALKCKSATHVRAVASATVGGDPTGVWGCIRVERGSCANHPNYVGPVFVLTKQGRDGFTKLGMQMLPDLAELLPGQLRIAAQSARSVPIQHKRFGLWDVLFPYARLEPDAARELAGLIFQAAG